MRTPKVTWTDVDGLQHVFVFTAKDYTLFEPKWIPIDDEYKNPFTKARTVKRHGYYYEAALTIDGTPYANGEIDTLPFGGLFHADVSDLMFYPNTDSRTQRLNEEHYPVTVGDLQYTDWLGAFAKGITVTFTSKGKYKTAAAPTEKCWGSRTLTFASPLDFTGAYSSGVKPPTTTIPTVGAVTISQILDTDATATANINPKGVDVAYEFEYWKASAPTKIFRTGLKTTNAAAAFNAVEKLPGLDPNTAYAIRMTVHYNDASKMDIPVSSGQTDFTTSTDF